MRLFIDEDLTPRLTQTCWDRGYEATSVRDRDRLETKDHVHAGFVFEGEWILVTNNAGDFLKLAEERHMHPGLIFIELGTIADEQEWLAAALDQIEARSSEQGMPPAAFMTNHVVEVDAEGTCTDYEWPG